MARTRQTQTEPKAALAPEQAPAKEPEQTAASEPVQEPAKAPEQEAAQAPKQGMLKVSNPTKGFFVQPVTGLRIAAGEVRELRNDAWLGLQLKAGTLKKA